MLSHGLIAQCDNSQYALTKTGLVWFKEQSIELNESSSGKLSNIRGCLDWTERQHHLSGPVGAQMMQFFLHRNWITRKPGTRALQVTTRGRQAFEKHFGVTLTLAR